MALTIIVDAYPAPFNFSTNAPYRDNLTEEQLEILEYYPQTERAVRFCQKSWINIDQHTSTYRVTSARIVDALSKCLSFIELEIYGISQFSSSSNFYLKRSLGGQVFFANIQKNIKNFSLQMKLAHTNAPYRDGQIYSVKISLTEDASNSIAIVESWDNIDNIISKENDAPFFEVTDMMNRILDGLSVETVI